MTDKPEDLMLVGEGRLVPDLRAIRMIESYAARIAIANTIPDVLRCVTQAEAIQAVMQKIKASEDVRRAALALRVSAERQLGRLTKALPRAKRGGYVKAHPGQTTKKQLLHAHGIHHFRAATAEKLADAPDEVVDAAVAASSSTQSLRAVTSSLGFTAPFSRDYPPARKVLSDLRFLASEALDLLERTVREGRPAHTGTVAELRDRLKRLETVRTS